MSQIISEPTRVTANSLSIIDLIYTNIESIVDSGVIDANISDHFLTFVKVVLNVQKSTSISFFYRSIRRINLQEFQIDLEQINWHAMLYLYNTDEKLIFFNDSIINLFNKHAPLKQFRKNNNYSYAPWITDNIKLMQKLRNKALKKFKETKNPSQYEYYKQLRNYATSAIRAEKKQYLRNKFNNSNIKGKWGELRRLNPLKQNNRQLPVNLSNPENINRFFLNSVDPTIISKPEMLNYYNNNVLENVNKPFYFHLSNEEEISNIIMKVNTKAIGADKINISMLLLCCPFVIPFVTHIINECILNSYFPVQWKQAQVIPLPKNSNPSEYGHLRGISILPTLSKVLERIMEKQIRKFLDKFNVLPPKQSGFRPNYSCESALACITDDILKASDKSEASVLVSLDFSKAFDMLNHSILCSMLHFIGFSENAQQFISSFLIDRTQQVVYDGQYSSIMPVRVGVPQGSILGPLLYTIYTSNFCKSIQNCNYHFYADDTQLYYSFPGQQVVGAINTINNDLAHFYTFASDHLLKLNPTKSSVILFGSQTQVDFIKNNFEIKLNNTPLPFTKTCKILGLLLDSRLRFKEHVTGKLRIAFGILKLIYSQRTFLTTETKKMLCNSLVLSQFNHCNVVFYSCLDASDRYRIQKIQNACLRLIYGVRRRNHITPFLNQSQWLNMFNRYRLRMIYFCYKLLKYKTPTYLYERMSFRADIHNLNLRRRGLLTVPLHRKEILKRSFSYNVAFHINNLGHTDLEQSNYSFKKSFKTHLLRLQ